METSNPDEVKREKRNVMKKQSILRWIASLMIVTMMLMTFASCENLHGTPTEKEDDITVEDGYLVVNGVKTDYQVKIEDVIEVVDGYVVVNGVKTEYEVNKADSISVKDGYLVVNGVTTNHKVHTEPVISVVDGYVTVNGVKTEYKVTECDHIWETVTVAPACTTDGYDVMTCKICEYSIVANKTAKLGHSYSNSYTFDDTYHWFNCIRCGEVDSKNIHIFGDDGVCTVCDMPLSSTPGVVYDVSADGTYVDVINYIGTSSIVKIASEYNGLPVKSIYYQAFRGNRNITKVIIPDSVTSIGFEAFYGCRALTSVNIPDSVTRIESRTFYECHSLANVTIGNSVTSIGEYAFFFCESLTSITILDSVTYIGPYAFQYCGYLTNVTIGNSVTIIDEYAFSGCPYTEYNHGKYIGDANNPYAVLIGVTDTKLSTYEIHENTRVLAYGAFSGCGRFGSITFPASISGVGESAFYGCGSLTNIRFEGTVEQWNAISFGCDPFGYEWNSSIPATEVICTDGVVSLTETTESGGLELPTVPVAPVG